MIVAPYNAHVARLQRELPRDTRIGTVDKFQGQEAPVAIYSMATSTPDEAPRGLVPWEVEAGTGALSQRNGC